VSQILDERPVASGEADGPGRGAQRHWYRWILLLAPALVAVACVVALATGVADFGPAVPSPVARHSAAGGNGTGVVRILPSTGEVLGGPSFPELNGIADGLGSLWVTGGDAGQNHILYAVDPGTSRIKARVELPSRLVINPNDVATGSGAVGVAVGARVDRFDPPHTLASRVVTRAFATLPHGGLIGDIVVDAGAVWVTDTTHGRVYRFAASTGRLEAVVAVGTTAGAMAVGDGGVWVADPDAHTVSRISVARNRVDSVATVPGVPGHIAASASGLWVTGGTGGIVTVLDRASGRVLTVQVDGEPTGVAAIGDTVWVANTANGTLSRIDARRHVVVATVPCRHTPLRRCS